MPGHNDPRGTSSDSSNQKSRTPSPDPITKLMKEKDLKKLETGLDKLDTSQLNQFLQEVKDIKKFAIGYRKLSERQKKPSSIEVDDSEGDFKNAFAKLSSNTEKMKLLIEVKDIDDFEYGFGKLDEEEKGLKTQLALTLDTMREGCKNDSGQVPGNLRALYNQMGGKASRIPNKYFNYNKSTSKVVNPAVPRKNSDNSVKNKIAPVSRRDSTNSDNSWTGVESRSNRTPSRAYTATSSDWEDLDKERSGSGKRNSATSSKSGEPSRNKGRGKETKR